MSKFGKNNEKLLQAVADIKDAILQGQYEAAKGVNRIQLAVYYGIGKYISQHTRKNVWGTGALEAISNQLRRELPGLRGYSATQMKEMRLFYEAWIMLDAKSSVATDDLKESASAIAEIQIIPAVLRHEYIYSLEAAHTRPEVFMDFIADRVIATQLDLLRLMREDDDTVNDTVNDTVKAVAPQLSKSEQTVLNAISLYPNYSYEKLATYCQLSRPTIARTIKALQSREFIRRIGSDKTGHWEVIKGKEDEV